MRKQAEILGRSTALEHLGNMVSQRAQLGAVLYLILKILRYILY